MRTNVSAAMLIGCLVLVAISHAQIGYNESGSAPSLAGLALIDTSGGVGKNLNNVGGHRFTIVVVRENPLLLDADTGATWRLVFSDANDVPLRWDPIPAGKATIPVPAESSKEPADGGRTTTPCDDDCDPFSNEP